MTYVDSVGANTYIDVQDHALGLTNLKNAWTFTCPVPTTGFTDPVLNRVIDLTFMTWCTCYVPTVPVDGGTYPSNPGLLKSTVTTCVDASVDINGACTPLPSAANGLTPNTDLPCVGTPGV